MLNRMPSLPLTSASHYMPQRLLVFALYLGLAAIPACAQSHGKNYFPLANAAQWTYAGSLSSPDAKKPPMPVQVKARVEGKTLIHGKEYFKYVITAEFSGVTKTPKLSEDVRYYRVDRDGIHFLSGKNLDGPERLEIAMPIRIGVKWLSGTNEAWAERAGTIKAGGREYSNCLKITYMTAGGTRTVEYYLAPGVGMIRAVDTDTSEPRSVMDITLETYKP
jgi:hypothetical protein